jgi:ABC-type branched-subunit amino acid transport system permease subunit
MGGARNALAWLAAIVAASALAFWLGGYATDVYRKMLIWVALALSYNFLFGIAGQVAFSHFAFAGSKGFISRWPRSRSRSLSWSLSAKAVISQAARAASPIIGCPVCSATQSRTNAAPNGSASLCARITTA